MSNNNLSPTQAAEFVGCPSCDKLVHTALLVSHSIKCAAARDAKLAKAIEFDTTEYEFSHGKKPSGRGSWAFCPIDKSRGNDYLDHTKFFPTSTFAEAKKAARAFFAGKTDMLSVCS